MIYTIWYDTSQNNLILSMVRKASQSVITHHSKKFPNLTRITVAIIPDGFQCGDIAVRHWRYNSESKMIEEIVPSDAEKLTSAKTKKISEIKDITGKYILDAYPLQQQINIIRIGTDAELDAMTVYIDSVRAVSDAAEVEVIAKDTLAKVEDYTFTL